MSELSDDFASPSSPGVTSTRVPEGKGSHLRKRPAPNSASARPALKLLNTQPRPVGSVASSLTADIEGVGGGKAKRNSAAAAQRAPPGGDGAIEGPVAAETETEPEPLSAQTAHDRGGHRGLQALRTLSRKQQIRHSRLSDTVTEVLKRCGQWPLYSHQAEACQAVLNGESIVVATPTASGKSLTFYLPVLEALVETQGKARALFLFPLKALARDQLGKLRGYVQKVQEVVAGDVQSAPDGRGKKLQDAVEGFEVHSYDGDTPVEERPGIRRRSRVIMTNPDMLHCAMLPNHSMWGPFLRNLRYIIIDEAHHYRGAFGSHMALLLRRLLRICKTVYNSEPQIISATATIGNPAEHVQRLTSHKVVPITESGAPSGEKYVVMWQPPMETNAEGDEVMRSPYLETADVVATCMEAGLQTLAFVAARKLTEIISKYTHSKLLKSPRTQALAQMVESYRGGYSPLERRGIEDRLSSGQLRGLVATNALELGIDVGDLDATVHVGVPVHMHELWQQDMFYMQSPEAYFSRPCEEALIDTNNFGLLRLHLMYAAHESPLTTADVRAFGPLFASVVEDLLVTGLCRQCSATRSFRPQVELAQTSGIRGNTSMASYSLLNTEDGNAVVEEVDSGKVDSVAHEGAIFLHRQHHYLVEKRDMAARAVYVRPYPHGHYTIPKEERTVTIITQTSRKAVGAGTAAWGDITVSQTVTGYKKCNLFTQKVLCEKSLPRADYPPTILKTKAMWITVPLDLAARLEKNSFDVLEAIHGIKNLAMCKVPEMTLCDPRDVNGHAEMQHGMTELPTIFLYDFHEGGIGVTAKAFQSTNSTLLQQLLDIVTSCPCSRGCPSCLLTDNRTDPSHTAKEGCKMCLEGLLGTWMTPLAVRDLKY